MDAEAAMKRIPPHSIEAEQAVLGAMLMNKDAVMIVSEIITGEDFYQTAYGILFEAIVDLFKAGRPVDLITLQEHLKEKDVLAGSQQHGICQGTSGGGGHFSKCEILCRDRERQGGAAPADPDQ